MNESGITLGNISETIVTPTTFHSYVTDLGMIICFEESKDENGKTLWLLPLILETVSQRDPATGKVTRSQGFRPLVPLSRDTKFIPCTTPNAVKFLCEIIDEPMENAYRGTVRDIRAQLSGIVLPPSQGIVGSNNSPIVTA